MRCHIFEQQQQSNQPTRFLRTRSSPFLFTLQQKLEQPISNPATLFVN
jgi:hypothetical protein